MTSDTANFSPTEQLLLLDLARQAIASRWSSPQDQALPTRHDLPTHLREPGACFVTLEEDGELRGCIGSLLAHRPLAEDVWENARAAAFDDPRFAPVEADELAQLSISISVLTKPEIFPVKSEEELLQKVRPGIDGLILTSGYRKATFLPAVWEDLPEPRDFVRHLKVKAGMKRTEWPADMEVERYHAISIKEPVSSR